MWQPDSQFVTYKQYSYYTPTPWYRDCFKMFFRMDKAQYSSQTPDCEGGRCDCKNDEGEVAVINAKVSFTEGCSASPGTFGRTRAPREREGAPPVHTCHDGAHKMIALLWGTHSSTTFLFAPPSHLVHTCVWHMARRFVHSCLLTCVWLVHTCAQFFQMLEKWKPAGVMGLLSQELFEEFRSAFTGKFVDSVRYSFIPTFFETVYEYRNSVYTTDSISELFTNLRDEYGEDWLISRFMGSHLEDKITFEQCGDINVPPDKSLFCPIGTANFVFLYAKTFDSSLTYTESKIVLGLDPAFPAASPFTIGGGEKEGGGFDRWFGAAVMLEVVSRPLVGWDVAAGEMDTFNLATTHLNELVAECQLWDGADAESCTYKIIGICDMMYNVWSYSDHPKTRTHEEWMTAEANR